MVALALVVAKVVIRRMRSQRPKSKLIAGRLLWPLLANLMRLAIVAVGGWLALGWSGDLLHVFLALSAALAVFGLMNAAAVAGGVWFGPIGWPRMPAALLPSTDNTECGQRNTERKPNDSATRRSNAPI